MAEETTVEVVDGLDPPKAFPGFHNDPLGPVLFASTPVTISSEQEGAVRQVLLLSSSDTRFAQKAADALRIILLGGINGGVVPEITSLNPDTGVANAPPPPLKLRVMGTGFDAGTKILVNGALVNTTYVSNSEVFSNISMNGAIPGVKQVSVQSGFGVISNSMEFTVTAAVEAPASVSAPAPALTKTAEKSTKK